MQTASEDRTLSFTCVIPMAVPAPQTFEVFAHFRANLNSRIVEVDEGDGNSFHLGPILRKYTSARLTVLPGRRVTSVEFSLLFDALGLLRSLQYAMNTFPHFVFVTL